MPSWPPIMPRMPSMPCCSGTAWASWDCSSAAETSAGAAIATPAARAMPAIIDLFIGNSPCMILQYNRRATGAHSPPAGGSPD